MVLASTGPGCLGVLSVTLTSVATHLPFIHNPYRATAQKLSSKLVPVTRTATSVRDFRIRSLTDAIDELQRPKPNLELTGTWRKDKAASDAMDEACDMVALPWIFRQALIVLNTLKLEDTPEHFKTVLKAGGVMDVKERYPWSGEVVEHSRRDKRGGKHLGRVVRTQDGPCIEVTWDDPYGGECKDTFVLSDDGTTLTQVTEMRIRGSGRETRYSTVYRRVVGS